MTGELFGRLKPTAIQGLISAPVNQKAERRVCRCVCTTAKWPNAHTPFKVGADKVNIVPDEYITLSFFISPRRPIKTS